LLRINGHPEYLSLIRAIAEVTNSVGARLRGNEWLFA